MALDLAGYFGRINYRGAAEPNLDVLQGLVTAHTQSIPFENLDPLVGRTGRRPEPGGFARQAGAPAPRRLLLRAQRVDGLRAGRARLSGAAIGRAGGVDDAAGFAATGTDAHGVGGDVPRVAGVVSRRRRFRWSDADLADPPGNRRRPADDARAVPIGRPRRRAGPAGAAAWPVAVALRIRHRGPSRTSI